MRVLLYLSLCQDHRCLFMDAVKFADIIFELNLTDFHWLYQPQPVRARIQYKIALGLYWHSKYTHRPTQLSDLYGTSISNVITSSQLQRPCLYFTSFTMLGPGLFFGSRAFCHATPTIWNSLLNTVFTKNSSKFINIGQEHCYIVHLWTWCRCRPR